MSADRVPRRIFLKAVLASGVGWREYIAYSASPTLAEEHPQEEIHAYLEVLESVVRLTLFIPAPGGRGKGERLGSFQRSINGRLGCQVGDAKAISQAIRSLLLEAEVNTDVFVRVIQRLFIGCTGARGSDRIEFVARCAQECDLAVLDVRVRPVPAAIAPY